MADPPTKTCAGCGRTIAWRRAWSRSWDEVRWCSDGCRRRKVRTVDRDLESAILALLERRAAGKTICPSDAARHVHAERGGTGDGWRELMEPARAAARRLVERGEVEITQQGHVVDPSTAKGAIRIRRVQRSA